MIIVKRDGTEVPYDLERISTAIAGAFEDVGNDEFDDLFVLDVIEQMIKDSKKDKISVEEIQDMVEIALMESGYVDEAKAYILYRYEHELARRQQQEKAVEEKLLASNVQNQNANVDEYSFGGRKGEADNVVMKQFALDNLVSKMARDNHLNNEIYIHDLDSYAVGMHNCLSIPFDDLLANGFNTRQTDVRPANSVNTAMQLVAVIFQLQSLQQFGGVAATHLDWTMVPYVRKSFIKHYIEAVEDIADAWIYSKSNNAKKYDELSSELQKMMDEKNNFTYQLRLLSKTDKVKDISITDENYYPNKYFNEREVALERLIKEVHQAVEGMYHNLNTLQSRSGNQLPFTSINYGTCTLPEGRMVTKALLEVSIEGLGKLHKTSIFPCGIFQCMKNINRKPGDPNYDLFQLALKSTAQRLYPNYANVDWSNNAGYDINDPRTYFSTMGLVA